MKRGLRNNNPGNIRHDNKQWKGEVIPSGDKEFKQFQSMAWGYRAMFHLLNNYRKMYGINTIRGMINRWAPKEDGNDPQIYTRVVSDGSKIGADCRITTTNKDVMIPIVAAMSKMENGKPAEMRYVEEGWELFTRYSK